MAVNSEIKLASPDPRASRSNGESLRQSVRAGIGALQLPIDIAPLVFFRIFFGVVMIYHVVSYFRDGWIDFFYIRPDFHLTYPGFSWVRPWPGNGMYWHFGVMGLAAVGVMCGALYRLSALLFFLTFTHAFLIEKALYQNHYYLVCLISGIMIFLPAHRALSVDAWLRPSIRSQTAAAGWLWLLRFQLAIPYFYGGLAKLNADWLHGMPIKLWLERRSYLPYVGEWLAEESTAMLFAYGGLLFDLLIVPALLWKRTRMLAYGAALAFHLTNAVLWEIGIFPWFMIGATTLFFSPGWIRRLLLRSRIKPEPLPPEPLQWTWRRRCFATGIALYAGWQLLFPFRHFAYPGDVNWTEEGHHFAWHMMLREKDVGIRFFVHEPQSGTRGLVKVSDFLNERQLSRMGKDPDMVIEFVHYVRDHYRQHANVDLEIRVLALASLNGRKPQLLMDPTIDYTKVDRVYWGLQPWIVPLEEPLRPEGWRVPLHEWEWVLRDRIPADMLLSPVTVSEAP